MTATVSRSRKTRRYAPPERPTIKEWPRWVAALDALKAQARLGLARLPGNPFNASQPTTDEIAEVRASLVAHDIECKAIAGLLLSGRLGEDTTIPDLTPERLRAFWTSDSA
jgi:hypothetical protein